MTIYVMTRTPSPDELRLLEKGAENVCFLTGQALLGAPKLLDGHTIWVMDEEVRELGIDCKLPDGFHTKSAHDIVEALAGAKILNL